MEVCEMTLLKDRNFLFLWLGQSISAIGDRFYKIAMMWYIIERTGSSMALGISVLCFTLPSILFMPWAGVLADTNSKKKILVSTDLINGILMIIIAFLVTVKQVPLYSLYACMIFSSSVTALFNPSLSASVPLVAGKENLSKANSLTQATKQMANIIGPALAGILIGLANMKLLFLLNGLSFILSAIFEIFVVIPKIKVRAGQTKFFSDFKDGLSYLTSSKELLYLIIVGGVIINFFLAPLNIYLTILCNQILEVGATGLGFIDSSIAIGALSGSVYLLFNTTHKTVTIVIIGLLLEGIALIIGGIFTTYLPILLMGFILGLGISMASIGIITLYQLLIPSDKLGRAMSLLSTLSIITLPIGTLAGSFLINHLSLSLILSVSGACILLSALTLIKPFSRGDHGEYAVKSRGRVL